MTANPTVTIEMADGGVMTAELFPDIAPITVQNFTDLARRGFYDGLIFHRVIPGFMIQGGCPEGSGTGGPGRQIKGEFAQNGVPNSLRHVKGVLSMARSGHPDSAGSQFFIMVDAAAHLDGSYAAFGRLVAGQDVADRIAAAERDRRDKPLQPQIMKKVVVTAGETDGAAGETDSAPAGA